MRIDAIAPARVHNTIGTRSSGGGNVTGAPRAAETPSPWSTADIEAFRVFVEANRRTESGAVATFSTLRTTAGPSYRASFGVAQLSIREHLARLSRMSDSTLGGLGTSRGELGAMRSRGEAMAAFYHLVVDRRDVTRSAVQLGLDELTQSRLRSIAESRDASALRSLIGERFTGTTGLPAHALDALLHTRELRDASTRAAFVARYERDHGTAFDPMHRDAARMAITARHLASSRPELAAVAGSLGGDDAAYASIGHYLGVGDSAENLLGWHARAAGTAVGDARLAALLASVDGSTSHAREMENFERALAAVARIGDLEGADRVGTLARIGRMFHGSPTETREALFVDGRLDAPRHATRAELEASLDRLREGRRWSDERLARCVADVLRERREP